MNAVAYETSSLIYHAKPICYVCNRRLLSLSPLSPLSFFSFSVFMEAKLQQLIHRSLKKKLGKVEFLNQLNSCKTYLTVRWNTTEGEIRS